jgi:hypothetical protein
LTVPSIATIGRFFLLVEFYCVQADDPSFLSRNNKTSASSKADVILSLRAIGREFRRPNFVQWGKDYPMEEFYWKNGGAQLEDLLSNNSEVLKEIKVVMEDGMCSFGSRGPVQLPCEGQRS